MNKLFINRLFFKNYVNNSLKDFELRKDINNENNLPKNYFLSYNYKNLMIEEYLFGKTIKIFKNNKRLSLFIKPIHNNYKLCMFFNSRKYKLKKIKKKIKIKKK
jgi:hypothetical protein